MTQIGEIAKGVYRICLCAPSNPCSGFNQFLINGGALGES